MIRGFDMGLVIVATAGVMAAAGAQDPSAFKPGPRIEAFGPAAAVDGVAFATDAEFRVVFDISDGGRDGALNRKFVMVARYLNMHAAAGLPDEKVKAAVVLHGAAARDVTKSDHYGAANPNAPLIAALIEEGVPVVVCGQSAAASGIERSDLLPGVSMDLSAMTANARFQQAGYTLNPF